MKKGISSAARMFLEGWVEETMERESDGVNIYDEKRKIIEARSKWEAEGYQIPFLMRQQTDIWRLEMETRYRE